MAITLFYKRDNLANQGAAVRWLLARLNGWERSSMGSETDARMR